MERESRKTTKPIGSHKNLIKALSRFFSSFLPPPPLVHVSVCSFILLFTLFIAAVNAETDANDQRIYPLIEGVYYLVDQKQPEQAIPFFYRAIHLDPSAPDAYYFLGVSYYRLSDGARRYLPEALFYLREAEKRGIQYDTFRPDLVSEIQRQYPGIQPAATAIPPSDGHAQIVVESKIPINGQVVIQHGDQKNEYPLGERIPLAGGERYTMRFKKKGIGAFFKPLVLVGSVVGIWLFR